LHQDLISEVINKIETPAQANLLSVVISVKFAQHVITVKQAIEELLVKSGYDLDSNYVQPFGKIFPSASAKNSLSIDTAITSSKTSGFITPFNKVLASGFNI
jgi:hypothetical protein